MMMIIIICGGEHALLERGEGYVGATDSSQFLDHHEQNSDFARKRIES
jgi:hypothetical protein